MSVHMPKGFNPAPVSARKPSLLAKYGKPTHKRVAKVLGYALTLDSPLGWAALLKALREQLTERERAGLAFTALTSVSEATGALVVSKWGNEAGMPNPPLLGHLDEAAFWADLATAPELDAYALASFKRMSPTRKTEFIKHITGGNCYE